MSYAAGFRFSRIDAIVIVACAFLTWFAWKALGSLTLVFPVTLGHFFLFCNVFRIRRSYELIWSGVYVANLAYWVLLRDLSWFGILAVQSPLTVAFILREMRDPRYHGVFWRRLNPAGSQSPSKAS